MNRERLTEILSRYSALRIAVVGDYFLDRYWEINAQLDEPSLETGLTAYQAVQCRCTPGAAGTVVNNLIALGVGKVYAIGFTGQDGEGYELRKNFQKNGVNRQYLLEVSDRLTPCYTKPLRNGNELNRFDMKNRTTTSSDVEDYIIASVQEVFSQVDAVMIMDQVSEENCGVITKNVREVLIQLARQSKSTVVYADSRERIDLFQKMLVKCNVKELLNVFDQPLTDSLSLNELSNYGKKLSEQTERTVFVTLGEKGQLVINDDLHTTGQFEIHGIETRDDYFTGNEIPGVIHVPAVNVSGEIDICGAGDAASSGIVASLCAGANTLEAAFIGNLAASITIRQIGRTGTASREQILSTLSDSVDVTAV